MGDGEVAARTQEALDLAATYVFGTEPGRIPAVVFEAYDATDAPRDRALLAAALARLWAYAGQHGRAVPFAVAAVGHAEAAGDPVVLADALDAALATHWGPDDLEVRVDLTDRLADVAAHLTDVDARTRAHLWLLTVATETLDVPGLNREMRALERLGEESGRALFFAASRRLMLDLMRGNTDTRAQLVALAEETQDELPDGPLVVGAMRGYGGAQAGDQSALEIADWAAQLAVDEGIRELAAEIAWIYSALGHPDQARRLAAGFDARVLQHLPRDHNYLLVLQLLLDLALRDGLDQLVADVTPLLMPYAGRAVVNAGAVMFHGVTDDTLARACERLGDPERAAALRAKALETYERIGARWWYDRLLAAMPAGPEQPAATATTSTMTLRPGPPGVWLVGRGDAESALPARRGFEHLHALLSRPGVEVPALDLAGGAGTVVQGGLGEVADAQALASYRRRLAQIDVELDDADAVGDQERGERLTAERTALVAELGSVTGLGGRARTSGGSDERARVTVRKAVAAALEAIHAVDPVVARHLTAHVHTGLWCRYDPDPDAPVEWRL
ncbi:hypothetical protein J2X46_001566 [Nocardioides sp. BE266]|uniref:hypothetical protein n=1 Tax=Nocardioides sp. BE266 TaxID=2817725 RepID=UPI00285902FE|nr:hypothetical protein [Nocardioides sp. BE266]MDR7252590.1 hypothetical protein [Nocardioides sp. BE266]